MKKRIVEPSKILVAMPTWVGDAAMSTPLIASLHKAYPSATIDVLMKPYLRRLLDDTPWLDTVIEWSKHESWLSLRARIKQARYDWAILLSNSFRPAWLVWWAGVRRRIGYARNGRSMLLTDPLCFPRTTPFRMIDYYGAIAKQLDVPIRQHTLCLHVCDADKVTADKLFATHGIVEDKPVIGINPGAQYGSSKCWPPTYFAQTADTLITSYAAQVVILVGPGEDELAQDIAGHMQNPAIVFPSNNVDLGILKAVIQRLDLVITNDTGPRHLAAALGIPTVTLFGPTHTTWGDSGFDKSIELAIQVDCGPCMKRTCPLDHHRCMDDLKPQAVIVAAKQLLRRFPPQRRG